LSAVPAATPDEGSLVQGIRRHLEGLKSTPDGAALYMMIERGLRRYGGGAGQMEHAFLDFLRGILARHAKDPNTDPATRVKARMIQQRLALAMPQRSQTVSSGGGVSGRRKTLLPASPTLSVSDDLPPAGTSAQHDSEPHRVSPADIEPEAARGSTTSQESAPGQAAEVEPADSGNAWPLKPPEPVSTAAGEAVGTGDSGSGETKPEAGTGDAPPTESTEKLAAIGETLVDRVTETITFNSEFDDVVATEQSALARADKAINDFNDLKQLLVRGLDDLVRERDELKERLSTAAEFLKAVEADRRKLKGELGRLRKHALADELTGLPKREVFVKSLEAEISRVRRYGFALALAVLDVDGLERINQQFGREAGDAVLRTYANEILGNFRNYDLVARYGEDEFAVLFPNTQKEGALRAIEKAQKRASETYLSHNGRSFPIPTFSSVLTLYTPGERPEQLLRRAEDALDHAKLKGNARMVVALPGA